MNFFKVLYLSFAFMIALTFFSGIYSTIHIQNFRTIINQQNEINSQEYLSITAREMNIAGIEFKSQVQEWKNVLLRGYDPKLYKKYWGKFEKTEANFQKRMQKIQALLTKNGLDAQARSTEILLTHHKELGTKYRAALASTNPDEIGFSQKVDTLVRGVDRPTSKSLANLTKQLTTLNIEAQAIRLKNIDNEVLSFQKLNIMVQISLVLFIIILSWYIIRRIKHSIGSSPEYAIEICNEIALGNLNRNEIKYATSNKQQATSNKQQATSNKQQATSNKQQATSNKQQATSNKHYGFYKRYAYNA